MKIEMKTGNTYSKHSEFACKSSGIFILIFISALCLSINAWAQSDNALNELLSICKKAKTESEDNARFIKQFWKSEDNRYLESIKLYNTARAEFYEWIEFYKLESTAAIEDRSYKINSEALKSKIEDALQAVNRFNTFYYNDNGMNNTTARNSGPVSPVLNISSCFDAALGAIKFIHESKREKQATMKKELHDKLESYLLPVFNDIK